MGIVNAIMCITVLGLAISKSVYSLSIISLFNMVINGKLLCMVYKYSLDKEILLKGLRTLLNIVTTIVVVIFLLF